MSKLHDLTKLGHSIWLDYVRRSFITTKSRAGIPLEKKAIFLKS